MTLDDLDFDCSEDAQGYGSLDGAPSVTLS